MALFAIGDTHLSFASDKKMDKFSGWEDYENLLRNNWKRTVGESDVVVVAGDISWAMKLEQTFEDFNFLHNLPGKKIFVKGNHDYWWGTKTKIEKWLAKCGFDDISILFNNAYAYGDYAICGTRGWSYDCPDEERDVLMREVGRLDKSLEEGTALGLEPVVFLHYPPVYSNYVCEEIMEILEKFSVKRCYYGHLHGVAGERAFIGEFRGIKMNLISADYVNFCPQLILS